MRQDEWSSRLVAAVAESVRGYRGRHKMSARQLADACGRLGYPIPRSVLTNLENGRREAVTLAEWLVLSAALGVPPLLLLFPIGRVDVVEPVPGAEVDPLVAVRWLETGRLGVRHADVVEPAPDDVAHLIERYHRHGELVGMLTGTEGTAEAIRRFSEDSETDLAVLEREQRAKVAALWEIRDRLRLQGFTPPELPESLRYVDEDPGL